MRWTFFRLPRQRLRANPSLVAPASEAGPIDLTTRRRARGDASGSRPGLTAVRDDASVAASYSLGRIMLQLTAAAGLLLGSMTAALPQSLPAFKVAVLKFGTVNWELDTLAHHGLDAKHGFKLELADVAGEAAAKIAFQGGTADAMVSDWIWVARQRAAGKDFTFIPYSKSVGGLLVSGTSTAKTLADLKGATIGVAGGPLDKSWLLLRALSKKQFGFDLAAAAEPVFGAPPLIYKKALQGEMAGAINFWHFAAKMEAGGMRRLISVAGAAKALGLDPDTPLLGYVIKGELARAKPDLVAGFAAASREAKAILAKDDAEWDRLRPIMNAANDAEFAALKAGYREGIPSAAPVNEDAARRLLALMAELGGDELVGGATTLPDGVFYRAGR
jgi:NitT/TauT family transport system substrate-binding protein